jgi:hypothetical protein
MTNKIFFKINVLTLICLLSSLQTQAVFANTQKKATKKLEVYNAKIEDGTEEEINVLNNAEKISKTNKIHDEEEIKAQESMDKELDESTNHQEETKKIAETKDAKSKINNKKINEEIPFDEVPKEKINEIAERMKYTYDILKRFGRAYDYRTTTLSQLKLKLEELESKKETSQQ